MLRRLGGVLGRGHVGRAAFFHRRPSETYTDGAHGCSHGVRSGLSDRHDGLLCAGDPTPRFHLSLRGCVRRVFRLRFPRGSLALRRRRVDLVGGGDQALASCPDTSRCLGRLGLGRW